MTLSDEHFELSGPETLDDAVLRYMRARGVRLTTHEIAAYVFGSVAPTELQLTEIGAVLRRQIEAGSVKPSARRDG